MAETRRVIERPLSPHLGIYRMSITMLMSIVHRITGTALYFGTMLLARVVLPLPFAPRITQFSPALKPTSSRSHRVRSATRSVR